jgi:SAM-dependent methyltransferase
MHESVMAFGRAHLTRAVIKGKRVLEVGSMDVNGSLRTDVVELDPSTYLGVDFRDGEGVDEVCDAGALVERFGAASFDVIISTEMLEHAEDWRGAIVAMKAVLVPEGYLLLTARGPGMFLHGYPHDWWRFTREDIRRIFADFAILSLDNDPQAPGFLLFAKKNPFAAAVDLTSIHVAPVERPA